MILRWVNWNRSKATTSLVQGSTFLGTLLTLGELRGAEGQLLARFGLRSDRPTVHCRRWSRRGYSAGA